jgi:hypothetical protein
MAATAQLRVLSRHMTKTRRKKEHRGGPRAHSGRRTRYPNKIRRTRAIWLDADATKILDDKTTETHSSDSDFVNHLICKYGEAVKESDLPPLKWAGPQDK